VSGFPVASGSSLGGIEEGVEGVVVEEFELEQELGLECGQEQKRNEDMLSPNT